MSHRDFDTQPIPRVSGGGERRRAAIALLVLAVIAVAIVAVMVNVLGGSDHAPTTQSSFHFAGPPVTHTNKSSQPQPSSAPPSNSQSSTSDPTSSHPSSSRPSSQPRTSEPESSKPTKSKPRRSHAPRGPSNRRVSCPSAGVCPLPDDIGDALGALNSYRAQHGLRPVSGSVTSAAATCAATAAGRCPNGYHWEPVGRSGKQVIHKIAQRGGNRFLLSPRLRHVQIGWAYVPRQHSFYCALVAPGT